MESSGLVIRNAYVSSLIRELVELAKEILICASRIIIRTLNAILEYHNKSQSPNLSYVEDESVKIIETIKLTFQTSLKIEDDDEWRNVKDKMSGGGSRPRQYQRNVNIFKMDDTSLHLLDVCKSLMPFVSISGEFLCYASNVETGYK